MKNSKKNNLFGKKNKKYKKNSDTNFYSKNSNNSQINNRFSNNSSKNVVDDNLNFRDKSSNNYSSLKRSKPQNKSDNEFFTKASDMHQKNVNKKNLEDWIWGKHSVFEALISERAINRIWCTSEIFSSEKFYILLKELKSKGVLIEEVSWNRLSQLTLGSSHQGVALQLACSNTISLEKSINCSRGIVLEHANCKATP